MSNLRKNSFWSLISIGSYATAQWWILSFMARQGNIDQIGYFSIALSITTPFVVFSNMNLRYLYVSDKSGEFEFSDYVNLRKFMSFCILLLVATIALLSDYNFFTKMLIINVGIYKLIESFSDIFFAFHQKNEQMKIITKSVLVRSLLIFVIFTFFYYQTKDILICSALISCIYLITLLFIDIRFVPSNLFCFNLQISNLFKNTETSKKIIKLFKVGFPMGASLMIYSAIVVIPRFFIEKYIGITELGIYTALYYLYSAILLISIAFADAALPRFTAYQFENDHNSFWSLLRKYIYGTLIVIFLGAGFFWFIGPPFLKLAYGNIFEGFTRLFIMGLFVTGIEIINKFLVTCMTAKRILVLQPLLNLVTFVNLGVSCYFLSTNMTLYTVLWAQGIVFSIQMVLNVMVLVYWKKK